MEPLEADRGALGQILGDDEDAGRDLLALHERHQELSCLGVAVLTGLLVGDVLGDAEYCDIPGVAAAIRAECGAEMAGKMPSALVDGLCAVGGEDLGATLPCLGGKVNKGDEEGEEESHEVDDR
jgi:hypothetical protein